MKLKQRAAALALSAAMLLAPVAGGAEELGFSAGDLTRVSLEEALGAGEQIEVTVRPGIQLGTLAQSALGTEENEKKANALVNLVNKCQFTVTVYDDFGTACVGFDMKVDNVKVLHVDARIGEDGSLQAMSNLTGKYVFTLPEGSVDFEDAMSMMDGASLEDVEVGSAEFKALPAKDRLRIAGTDVGVMLISQLLGWTSYTQMDSDNGLYVFDNTPFEATDTRDPVAQRMIGTIAAADFNALLWNMAATLSDDHGPFQQALADVLAEQGVTRYQFRQVVDSLFTEEKMDPAADFVELSHNIPDDGALCKRGDISYLLKKIVKCVDNMWEYSEDVDLHMIVAYDDMGGMVGLELDLPVFTEVLPYEGAMVYDIRTDEYGQRFHTSHGELEILDHNRIIGDLDMKLGQDVAGANESSIAGRIGVVSQKDASDRGIVVDGGLNFVLGADGQSEEIGSWMNLLLDDTGATVAALRLSATGTTQLTETGVAIEGEAQIGADDVGALLANFAVSTGEYTGDGFVGGHAVDLTNLDEETIEGIKNEVMGNAGKLGASFILHPGVLTDIMTVIGE